jgi:hypothetical protein
MTEKEKKIDDIEKQLALLKEEVSRESPSNSEKENMRESSLGDSENKRIVATFLVFTLFVSAIIFWVKQDAKTSKTSSKEESREEIKVSALSDEEIDKLANYAWNDSMLHNYWGYVKQYIKEENKSKQDYYMEKLNEELQNVFFKEMAKHGADNAKKIQDKIVSGFLK